MQHEKSTRQVHEQSTKGKQAAEARDEDPSARRASAHQFVQLKGSGASRDAIHAAAADGIATAPKTAMPHAQAIQRSFGDAYDVSNIQAHVGGKSAAAMGASAYAAGNHVVFDKSPDLHTAAHEAAHVVQQRRGVSLYGGVGEVGDAYEQHADAVADRVVAGESAAGLLKSGPGGTAPGIQRAPSQTYADQSLLHEIQAHVKLTAARMYASAAKVYGHLGALKTGSGGPAGSAQMLMGIEAEVKFINSDLDSLHHAISRSKITKSEIQPELGRLHGALHDSQGWAAALGAVYSATHDQSGNVMEASIGMELGVTRSIALLDHIYQAAGVDKNDLKAAYAARVNDPDELAATRDEELKEAEAEALKNGMHSIQAALDLVKADLHSSVEDQSKQAFALTMSVQELVDIFEPIDAGHLGTMTKLPVLIGNVEKLQAEVMAMKDAGDDKGKALAPKIGYGTTLSVGLRRLKTKISDVKTMQAAAKKSRKR